MDEVLVCWLFLFFTTILRMVQQSQTGKDLQVQCHSFGPVVGLLSQWYTLIILGFGYLLLRTFYDIVLFDYWKFHFLSKDRYFPALNESIRYQMICDPNHFPNEEAVDIELQELALQGPVKILALWSPIAGMVAAGIVLYTAFKVVMDSREQWASTVVDGDQMYWAMNQRLNLVLMVVLTPLVFIVMAMRATLRQWAVMTGSSYSWYYHHQILANQTPSMTWREVKTLELATYEADLELAAFFQFTTIAMFGYLCGAFLSRSPHLHLDVDNEAPEEQEEEEVRSEYRRTLQWLSIQGLFAYVAVGAVRTVLSLVCTVLREHPGMEEIASKLQVQGLDSTQKVFIFSTVLCVINMKFIGKMKDIKDHLGKKVDLKFLGTRVLLLIAQMQLKIIGIFTVGSPLYLKVAKIVMQVNSHSQLNFEIEKWSFGQNKAQLLHSSLLIFWCLIVVIGNLLLWTMDREQLQGMLQDSTFKRRSSADLLLG